MQIGLLGILTIIFVTLKLSGVIFWSWWLVLAPIWIGIALTFLFLGIVAVGYRLSK